MSVTDAPSLEAISGAFMALCTIAVILRFCARKNQNMTLWADDWTMLAVLAFFIAFSSCTIVLTRNGILGQGALPFSHAQWPHEYEYAMRVIQASNVCLFLALTLTKVSALLLYKRIFCNTRSFNPVLHWIIVVTIVICCCWAVIFCFLSGFQCGGSFKGDWDPANNARNCGLANGFSEALYISDLILDIWVISIPIPLILTMRTPLLRKVLTIGIFSIAFVGVAASIVRLVDFVRVVVLHDTISRVSDEENINSSQYFYNTLELGMMIISINIPVLWGLFTKYAPEAILKMARSVTSLVSQYSGGSEHDHSRDGQSESREASCLPRQKSNCDFEISREGNDRPVELKQVQMDRMVRVPSEGDRGLDKV